MQNTSNLDINNIRKMSPLLSLHASLKIERPRRISFGGQTIILSSGLNITLAMKLKNN